MYLSGMTPHGYWNTPGDVPTTLTPAVRMRRTSVTASGIRLSPIAQYTAQSGSVASSASRSLVAAMPVDVIESGELARVLADLGVRGHPDPGQFEAGIADQVVERDTSYVARADMCDADRHCCLLKAAAGQLSNLSDAARDKQGRS